MRAARRAKGSRHRTKNLEMEQTRIQKLLMSEYSDFSDTVLVESPFAETTRNGRGIRQVSLALTPSKLIVAADVFKGGTDFFCPRALDPSIESFELISLYPLQYIRLSVFSRRQRKSLKARLSQTSRTLEVTWSSGAHCLTNINVIRFIDGRVNYYELGGIRGRNVYWRKWCEQVDSMLAKRMDGSSLSETTAASSSSSTTLYILSSEIEVRRGARKEGKKPVCRVWTRYGGAGDYAPPTWRQKDLYLGPSYNDLIDGRYAPIPVRFAGASLEDVKDELNDHSPGKFERNTCSWPTCRCYDDKHRNKGGLCDVLFIREHNRKYCNTSKFFAACQSCPCNHLQGKTFEDKGTEKRNVWYKDDVLDQFPTKEDKAREATTSPKYVTRRISRFGIGVPEKCHSGLVLGPTRWERESMLSKSGAHHAQNFHVLMENAVKVWEGNGKGCCKSANRAKHFRRYGLCTAPHFLYALGPWSVQLGERNILQGRRSFSLVSIRRQPVDPELKLPVSRRHLTTSISYAALQSGRIGAGGTAAKGRVVLFWTPEYWYRPRPASAAYRELRRHLNHLRSFRQERDRPVKRKLFCRRRKCRCDENAVIVAEEKPSFLERIFSSNGSCKRKKKFEDPENNSTRQLRKLLRMDFRITIWDINSTVLATQLTLVDRDLFARIPTEEIEIVVFERSSRSAPNLAAWIAFSHRVSCLTASEILSVKKLTMRSRIMARLINAARKCFAMGNFHSCRSILAGLQAPPIFRLRKSWSHLRTHHANRYEVMEKLCKIYKSPYAVAYRRAWSKVERNPPSMPHVGDLLARLLGLNDTEHHQRCDNIICSNNNVNRSGVLPVQSANANKGTRLQCNQDLEQQRGSNKGIIASVITRIKYKRDPNTIYEEKTDLSWTIKEQNLAWKYFHRWINVILKRKARLKEREKFRGMDPRMKRVLEVASWLTDCQKRAQGYEFSGHSFTREFLMKTRYREDRENFFISLKLEPSTIT